MLVGVPATSTLSWVYATTTWAVALVDGGTQVIGEVGAAVGGLVRQIRQSRDRLVLSAKTQVDRVVIRTGDLVCYAIALLVVVVTFDGAEETR